MAPGITAGVGTIISAATFIAVVFHSLAGDSSRLSLISASVQNDNVNVVIANTGKRSALVQSIGLICNIYGLEEADFFPNGASAYRLIVLKQGEVAQLGINTTRDADIGYLEPKQAFESLSRLLIKHLDMAGDTCTVAVLAIESTGETRRIYASSNGSIAIMVSLQRFLARQNGHDDMQIVSLNGALTGQYMQADRFLAPGALYKHLDLQEK